MNLRQEQQFEREICAHLAANGWLYAECDAALFNLANGLFLPDLLVWVETTQPENWQSPTKTHGAALAQVLAERIRKNINEWGTRIYTAFRAKCSSSDQCLGSQLKFKTSLHQSR